MLVLSVSRMKGSGEPLWPFGGGPRVSALKKLFHFVFRVVSDRLLVCAENREEKKNLKRASKINTFFVCVLILFLLSHCSRQQC